MNLINVLSTVKYMSSMLWKKCPNDKEVEHGFKTKMFCTVVESTIGNS